MSVFLINTYLIITIDTIGEVKQFRIHEFRLNGGDI